VSKPRQGEFIVTSVAISPIAHQRDVPELTHLGGHYVERIEPKRYSPVHIYSSLTIYPAGAGTFKDDFETYAHEIAHFEYFTEWQPDWYARELWRVYQRGKFGKMPTFEEARQQCAGQDEVSIGCLC
jgi:hypothetical protein